MPQKDLWPTRMTLLADIQDPHNNGAWEQFIDYYSPFVLGFLHRLNLNHDEKEEFHQKVFTKLWQLVEKQNFPEIHGRFRAWFKTVIHNEVKNYFKSQSLKNKKVKALETQFDTPNGQNEIDQWIEEEWHEFVSKKAWEIIEKEFSDTTKQAFLLSIDGKANDDIAETLNIKPSSVYVYKKRVTDRLKEEVKRIQEDIF